MPMSREQLLAHLHELRNEGARALKEIDNEFNSVYTWCSNALDFVQSEECPTDAPAVWLNKTPKVARNNNEPSCKSLETSTLIPRKLMVEEENLHESTLSTNSSSPLKDPVKKTKVPSRSSQRIKANSKLDESSSSETSSLADNLLTDPVKKAKRGPTRSSQRINASNSKLDESSTSETMSSSAERVLTRSSQRKNAKSASVQVEENDSTSSTTNIQSSSVNVLPTGNLRKNKPGQFKSKMQQIPSSTTQRPQPLSKKLLKEASTKCGPESAPKKLLKGTPTLPGPRPAFKKLVKGTHTLPAPGPTINKLIGTPTSSGLGLTSRKITKESAAPGQCHGMKAKATSQQNLVLPSEFLKGGISSKSDYVNQVAQEGLSHLAKMKGLVNPIPHSPIVKPGPIVKNPRETFVISRSSVGFSDFMQDSAEQVAQDGFSNVAGLKDQVKPDDEAPGSLMKAIQSAKDPRESSINQDSDVPNATFEIRHSNVANATFEIRTSNAANTTYEIRPSNVANATFEIRPSHVANTTFEIRPSIGANATFEIRPSNGPNATYEIQSSNDANTTFEIAFSDAAKSTFVGGSSDTEKRVQEAFSKLAMNEKPVKPGTGVTHAHGLNQTISVNKDPNATFEVNSYDVTLDPEERCPLPSKNKDDYGLDDVRSDDSSDDESNPKKVVPEWARAANRQDPLQMQYEVSQSQMFAFFESTQTTPDLTKLFSTSIIDRRILIRRSSAVWTSPTKSLQ